MTRFSIPHRVAGFFLVLAVLALAPVRMHGAFTDHFGPLLNELNFRSAVLTNKQDKLEKKQKKAADMCIRLISKGTNALRSEITAAGKVSRLLTKNFTNDFSARSFINLETLLEGVFTNLQADVVGSIDELASLINGLPGGKARTKALALFTTATNKLAAVNSSTDFFAWSQLLSSGLKSAASGITVAMKASGSTGGAEFKATVGIGGTNIMFVADDFGAEWVQTGGILDIMGSRTGVGSISVPVVSGFAGATGTYPLGGAGSYFDTHTFTVYIIQSGTLNISSFNAAGHSLSATFSFTATNASGPGTVTVNNGMATVKNLTVNP